MNNFILRYTLEWAILLSTLLSFSSCNNNEKRSYLELSESVLLAESVGIEREFSISSNCDYTISDIPSWCEIQKRNSNKESSLHIKVFPNNKYIKREAKIKIESDESIQYLSITQKGLKREDSLSWYSFSPNSFISMTFTENNNAERIYTLRAQTFFINPYIKDKVFLGNIISRDQELTNSLIDYENYSYNPVTIGALVNGKSYVKTISKPSKEEMYALTESIINELPIQNYSFNYDSSPLIYHSHRQLNLLGRGNLGLEIDKLITGYSYMDKEMSKSIGLIYSYNQILFNVTMDYPRIPTKEEIKDDVVYIDNINYGKTAFLIIETDYDYNIANNVIKRVMKKQTLNIEEQEVLADMNAFYLSFSINNRPNIEQGKENVIRRYIDAITTNPIIPISFSISNYPNISKGDITYQLILH